MKIERVQPYLVDRCLLVRVYTDAGRDRNRRGWPVGSSSPREGGVERSVAYFVGRDAGSIEHHHQSVTRDAHFAGPVLAAALSAIDIALWDILGQATGKPVAELLGGLCRTKLAVFMNIAGRDRGGVRGSGHGGCCQRLHVDPL